MGKTERRRTFLWILGLLLMLQAIAAFCFCMKKTGFHYDEYYSYYSSNVSVGLAPSDREWKTGESIRNEFQVLPEERFRFRDVVRMQTYDVHPPVYYLLLHAVCSLTPGIFTKWSGLALNLLFFAGSWCLVALLAWKISGKKKEIVLGSCLLYGFCPAILSGVALVRMYMLLGFWILLLTWLHVKALETRRRGWRFYIPAAVTVYLGFLTHYYFAVYLFFLAAAMECYLLFEQEEHKSWGKKWRDCFAYAAAVIGAMILAVLSYPACLGHIFRGYRGTEAMGAFFDLSNTLGRFRFFAGLLDEYGFGSCLPAFLLILILLLLTGAGLERRIGGKRMPMGRFLDRYRMFLVPAAAATGYFLVVTKTALLTAEEANRYQVPVYGLLHLLAVCLLGYCTARIGRQIGAKWSAAQGAACLALNAVTALLILFTAAGELWGLAGGRVLFLYEEDADNIAFAAENRSVPTVYWYNGNLAWMIWDDSLELMQYDEIYFASLADLSTVSDERIESAPRVLVYAARSDDSDAALEAVAEGMGKEVRTRKVRELLYCDLYELEAVR